MYMYICTTHLAYMYSRPTQMGRTPTQNDYVHVCSMDLYINTETYLFVSLKILIHEAVE